MTDIVVVRKCIDLILEDTMKVFPALTFGYLCSVFKEHYGQTSTRCK